METAPRRRSGFIEKPNQTVSNRRSSAARVMLV
jgi:hypothetical protein